MHCDDYQQLISKFIDRESSAQESVLVKEHIAVCQECKLLYDQFNETDELATASIHSEFFGESCLQSVFDTLERTQSKPVMPGTDARFRKSLVYPYIVIAAGLLLLLGSWVQSTVIPGKEAENWKEQSREFSGQLQNLRQQYEMLLNRNSQLQNNFDHVISDLQDVMNDQHRDFTLTRNTGDTISDIHPEDIDSVIAQEHNELLFFVYAHAENDANIIHWKIENASERIKGFDVERVESGMQSPSRNENKKLNENFIVGNYYVDTSIKPDTVYHYNVTLHTIDDQQIKGKVVTVKSRFNQKISFHALANSNTIPYQLLAYVKVHKYSNGEWVSEKFIVSPGDIIGGIEYCEQLGHEFDFSTGYALLAVERDMTEVRTHMEKVPLYDPFTEKPLRDNQGFILYEFRQKKYEVRNARMIFKDSDGGKRMLWLSSQVFDDNK